MRNDVKMHDSALKSLKHIIQGLNNDREFYEIDIDWEYTPFEDSLKSYCDSYFDFYLDNGCGEVFFNSLVSVVEAIVECNAENYYEDFFRPAELITYYFAKIASHDDDLKDLIHDWLVEFCSDFEGDMIVDDYFKPFIDGEKISNSDNYYADYADFNRMILVFK